jgi:hypothetical protein
MRKVLPEKNLPVILLGGIFALLIVGAGLFFTSRQSGSRVEPPPPPPPLTNITSAEELPALQMATLKAVGKIQGSGTATGVFANGQFLHTVTAQLPDPSKSKFYQGWLVKKTPQSEFLLTGRLVKEGNTYSLTYNQIDDASNYPGVIVTLEQKDDQKPETRVLEGSF